MGNQQPGEESMVICVRDPPQRMFLTVTTYPEGNNVDSGAMSDELISSGDELPE